MSNSASRSTGSSSDRRPSPTRNIPCFARFIALLVFGAIGFSCAPSDLEPIPVRDAATSDTADTAARDDGDASTDTAVFEPSDQFADVATILTTSCADSGCHGPQPNGSFHIEGGTNAGAIAVKNALADTTTSGGDPLISPGSKDDSALYVRITADIGAMPPAPNDPLTDEQVEAIGQWIENGANFE